jgi:hypothetical protein
MDCRLLGNKEATKIMSPVADLQNPRLSGDRN